MSKNIQVTQIKSAIGYTSNQKITLKSLGLRRIRHTVTQPDNPAVRGMIYHVKHLVRVAETSKAKQ